MKALIFPKNVSICRSPLPNVKHLKVQTSRMLKRESDLNDALHWISPFLETLSIKYK